MKYKKRERELSSKNEGREGEGEDEMAEKRGEKGENESGHRTHLTIMSP